MNYDPQDYLVPDSHATWMLVGAAVWAVIGIVLYFLVEGI
jgi:Flp pilus assembly protein TadB